MKISVRPRLPFFVEGGVWPCGLVPRGLLRVVEGHLPRPAQPSRGSRHRQEHPRSRRLQRRLLDLCCHRQRCGDLCCHRLLDRPRLGLCRWAPHTLGAKEAGLPAQKVERNNGSRAPSQGMLEQKCPIVLSSAVGGHLPRTVMSRTTVVEGHLRRPLSRACRLPRMLLVMCLAPLLLLSLRLSWPHRRRKFCRQLHQNRPPPYDADQLRCQGLPRTSLPLAVWVHVLTARMQLQEKAAREGNQQALL